MKKAMDEARSHYELQTGAKLIISERHSQDVVRYAQIGKNVTGAIKDTMAKKSAFKQPFLSLAAKGVPIAFVEETTQVSPAHINRAKSTRGQASLKNNDLVKKQRTEGNGRQRHSPALMPAVVAFFIDLMYVPSGAKRDTYILPMTKRAAYEKFALNYKRILAECYDKIMQTSEDTPFTRRVTALMRGLTDVKAKATDADKARKARGKRLWCGIPEHDEPVVMFSNGIARVLLHSLFPRDFVFLTTKFFKLGLCVIAFESGQQKIQLVKSAWRFTFHFCKVMLTNLDTCGVVDPCFFVIWSPPTQHAGMKRQKVIKCTCGHCLCHLFSTVNGF
jgi:hypothetical protein